MKIKGQGRISKYLTSKIASRKKEQFKQLLSSDNLTFKPSNINVNLNIISISGSYQFEDQILSIISFIVNVGLPNSWLVYSDGTHSTKQLELFTKLFSFIEVKMWSDITCNFPSEKHTFDSYIKKHPIGKKTFIVLNHRSEEPFIFADSDIVFYKPFKTYLPLLTHTNYSYYMVDNDWCCLDSNYMQTNDKEMFQLNSGLLLIQPSFKWGAAMDYLSYLEKIDKFEFFSDQTAIHIAFKNNTALPFDPRSFKVEMYDHFKLKVAPTTKQLSARHYVGTIRHKMWQKGWKWHLT